jgi:tRNA-specific adenosine deaminase 1
MPIGSSLADNVARVVLDSYESLANRGKPIIRSNGVHEWTMIAGVVAQNDGMN